jgi:hypothetical protein
LLQQLVLLNTVSPYNYDQNQKNNPESKRDWLSSLNVPF